MHYSFIIQLVNKKKIHYEFIKEHFNVYFTLKEFFSNNDLYCVEALNNTDLVGVAIFRMYIGKDGKKIAVYCYTLISKDFRRLGLNRQIKKRIEKIARDNGVYKITASVRGTNEPSIKSLLSLGYSTLDQRKFYKNGDIKVKFEKILYY